MSFTIAFSGGPIDGEQREIEHLTRWFECAFDLDTPRTIWVMGLPFPSYTGIWRYEIKQTPSGYTAESAGDVTPAEAA